MSDSLWNEIETRAALISGGKPRIAQLTVTNVKNKRTGYGFPGNDAYEKVVQILNEVNAEQKRETVCAIQQTQQVTQAVAPPAAQSKADPLSNLSDEEWDLIKNNLTAMKEQTFNAVKNIDNRAKKKYGIGSKSYNQVLAKAKELDIFPSNT